MGNKKREGHLLYQRTEGSDLDLPSKGQLLDNLEEIVGSEFPQGISQYSDEWRLRQAFASYIDPTSWEDAATRHDQLALNLIEVLLSPDTLSRKEQDESRRAIAEVVEKLYSDPGFERDPYQFKLTDAALNLKEALSFEDVQDPVFQPAIFMLDRLLNANNAEEIAEALLIPGISRRARPESSCIEPLTVPIYLIKLYFLIVLATEELSDHSGHTRKDLLPRDVCPVCELSRHSVVLASETVEMANGGPWQTLAFNMYQLGATLQTLNAQLDEYVWVLGAENASSEKTAEAKNGKREKNRRRALPGGKMRSLG